MYQNLIERHAEEMPEWAKGSPYQRMIVLHRILEGKLYDVLPTSFDQETKQGNIYIPMAERRPSVKYNMPRMTALKISRKMFAGRQKPSWRSGEGEDEATAKAADLLAREGLFFSQMKRAVFYGSAGAVAVSFSFRKDGAGNVRVVFNTHAAYECQPAFDVLGELVSLRINKCTSGAALLDIGLTTATDGPIEPKRTYWFICSYERNDYFEFVPIPVADYSPLDRSTWHHMHVIDDRSHRHGLGFVPAHWMCDLTLGALPWGGCYWECLVDNTIVNDYTLSQNARGLWYSAAPQLVTKGEIKNQQNGQRGRVISGPANLMQFDTTRKDAAGGSIEGGDAHLLEATGAGLAENREFSELLRKFSLEEVQSSRKDPDRMRTAGMSGAAMENMDEDFVDLMMDQRDTYCDQGSIVLMKKALRAGAMIGHPACVGLDEKAIGSLTHQYPPAFPPGSHEILEVTQALDLATGQPDVPAGPKTADGGPGTPAVPAKEPLIEIEEAKAIYRTFLNLPSIQPEPSRQQVPIGDDE